MSEMIKERKDIKEEYKWDLSSLYISDEQFLKSLDETDSFIEEINAFLHDLDCILYIFLILP